MYVCINLYTHCFSCSYSKSAYSRVGSSEQIMFLFIYVFTRLFGGNLRVSIMTHVYQVCTTLRVSINWKCGLSPIVIMAPLFCFHLHTFTFIFVTFARSSPFSNSPSVYLLCSTQFQSISLLGFHVSFIWIQQLPLFGIELILNVEGRQLELNSTQHQHVLSYIYVLIGF